jgi:hypothetical protein
MLSNPFSSHVRVRFSILLAALISTPSLANSLIIGLPADPSTGNCFPFGCAYLGEYQQVYTSSQFSGPLQITGLQFFNTEAEDPTNNATVMNSGNWTISLSTTSADWNTLSGTFASNVGTDNTQVFNGSLVQPWSFGDTLNIPLSTPFNYTPSQGNLLMDVSVTDSQAPNGFIYFDSNGYNLGLLNGNTIMGRVWHDGDINNGYGLVTGFVSNTSLPVLPPPTSAPVNFKFPLKADAVPSAGMPAFELITEAGGKSSDGTTDPFHTGGGYYSLDFQAHEVSDVVAAAPGIITQVAPSYSAQDGFGPVVTIYHGNGYFTEYREFTANPTVSVGDFVSAGQKIGDFIPFNTNNIANPDGNTALHFQVKYTPDFTSPASCTTHESCTQLVQDAQSAFGSGLGLSAQDVPQLQLVTLAGMPLGNYQLNANGQPTAVGSTTNSGQLFFSAALPFDNFFTVDATVAGSTAMLIEHSPAYVWKDVSIPLDAQYLSFDYYWPHVGDGDYLTVYLGTNLLFNSLGLDFSADEFISSNLIDISQFAGQTDQLLFWLNSVGDSNAEVDIRNLRFFGASLSSTTIPEPNTFFLFCIGLLLVPLVYNFPARRHAKRLRRSPQTVKL